MGGVFGVGFLREWMDSGISHEIEEEKEMIADEKKVLKALKAELNTLEEKQGKIQEDYERIVELYKLIATEEETLKAAKKHLKSVEKVKYVKRDAVKKIIAAWIITVPAAALLSALIFFVIKGMLT